MFTFALILSLACLAVPVSIFARMAITGRSVRAEIHSSMSMHRRTCCSHSVTRDADR
ncbi:hypothetical protein [Streptosporangium lutulentum]|uniref:Uncharacterized protein n=1 Tax=Streptosporangium lutulentum TaxID=1461250 RepID=A0ABT9QNM8_9ACTN|nr:hypothetical protein [Streptosporangium lutulentum]MDP9848000.1 hypothetical protein [Streptosporangium lutulentum]